MKDAEETPEVTPRPDGLETYRQLVELQSQIVDLARRNDETERSCQLLRARLTRQTPERSPGRIRQALFGVLQRISVWKEAGFGRGLTVTMDPTVSHANSPFESHE